MLVPDAIWSAMHPTTTVSRWYLLVSDEEAGVYVDEPMADAARETPRLEELGPAPVTPSPGELEPASPPAHETPLSDAFEPTQPERVSAQVALPRTLGSAAPSAEAPPASGADAASEPIPDECWDLVAMTVDHHGRLVIAWHSDDPDEHQDVSHIGAIARTGRFDWVQRGVPFSDRSILRLRRGEGTLLLLDTEDGRVMSLDPESGALRSTVVGPEEAGDGSELNVRETSDLNSSVVVDRDGSFLVNKEWDDRVDTALKRFSARGRPVPVWRGLSLDTGEDDLCPDWDEVNDFPALIPDGAQLAQGWDGCYYFVDEHARWLAKLDPTGKLLGIIETGIDHCDHVHTLDATSEGVVHILFAEVVERAGWNWPLLVRIFPDGRVDPFVGVRYADEPRIGMFDELLVVSPEGFVFVGSDIDSLRVISPDGELLFMTEATREREETYLLAEIEEAKAAAPRSLRST